ncbi:uncharacterized protein LOC141674343 [Apium graveolens]|uniref:uncharacterized protein LOC141674343 n=1 Tax=Apium graveolens TaxID=4045 RepID=UPI003D7BBBFA
MCQDAERVKKAKVHTLRIEFESLCMKDNEQLDHFYLRLNGLVTNMRALSGEMKEAYMVKKLLHAMPTKFLQIVSTLKHFRNLETLYVEEVVGYLKAHEERMKGGPERKVRVLITDWGGEFGLNEFMKFYEKDGITRHYTAPYTPQQNGVVKLLDTPCIC